MADVVIPIANLGSHPMHILCNAIVFDHYCHLRHDIGHAVPRAKALPHDPIALDATLEWMLAGLPQMCAGQLAGCTTGVNIAFEGDVERGYRLVPADDGWRVLDGTDATLATVVTSAHDFVAWGTKRSDWRDVTAVRGDATAVAATLDAINVI